MTSTPIATGVVPNRAPRARARSKSGERITLPVAYVYLMWIIALTDVHRWLAERGPRISAMNGALSFLLIPLIVMIIAKLPQALGRRSVVFYMPLLAFVSLALLTSLDAPRTPDRWGLVPWELAWSQIKVMLGFYILVLGALVYLDTPRRAMTLFLIYVGQFWWWGWHSGKTGAVWWHPTLANFDAFGPLVLIGLPLCMFFGLSTQSKWYKYGGFFLGAFCALGIVASIARGVVLSAILVVVVALVRAPRRYRLKAAATILVGIASFLITSATLFSDGFVWTEMKSAFSEGKDEGTGKDRWDLWTAAIGSWKSEPIMGVGLEQVRRTSYHLVAAGHVELDPESVYSKWPVALNFRELHNVWLQILAELGVVGMGIIVWLLIDFWRRNAAMRRKERVDYWYAVTGGRFNLSLWAAGLEAGMVAYVATGMFYNQLYENWLYALLGINMLLYVQSTPPTPRRIRRSRASSAVT